jgi:hypothetical protein
MAAHHNRAGTNEPTVVSADSALNQRFGLSRIANEVTAFVLRVSNRVQRAAAQRLPSVALPWRRAGTPSSSAAGETEVTVSIPQIFSEIFERNI